MVIVSVMTPTGLTECFLVLCSAKGIFDSLVWLGRTLITFKFAAVVVGVVKCFE